MTVYGGTFLPPACIALSESTVKKMRTATMTVIELIAPARQNLGSWVNIWQPPIQPRCLLKSVSVGRVRIAATFAQTRTWRSTTNFVGEQAPFHARHGCVLLSKSRAALRDAVQKR